MREPATIALLLLALLLPTAAAAGESSTDSLQISSDLRVIVLRGREIGLEVRARAGENYVAIAQRVAGSVLKAAALSAWNQDAVVEEGCWVSVPFPLLSSEYRSLALRTSGTTATR